MYVCKAFVLMYVDVLLAWHVLSCMYVCTHVCVYVRMYVWGLVCPWGPSELKPFFAVSNTHLFRSFLRKTVLLYIIYSF